MQIVRLVGSTPTPFRHAFQARVQTKEKTMAVTASGVGDFIAIVVKQDCPTCVHVVPALEQIAASDLPVRVFSQDDPSFPKGVGAVVDDTDLGQSYQMDIEIVPTAIRFEGGKETGRVIGWNRSEWEAFTGLENLGPDLAENRPGCGSLSLEPGRFEELEVRFKGDVMKSRRVTIDTYTDDMEVGYERGWSDGLPVVPPTEIRVMAMLKGTDRAPDEVIGVVPPNLAPCTVEKVAINAVMAGCKPEYLPVVLTAVEAALEDKFCMHGMLATTWLCGPIVIVSGPVTKAIGMNWAGNALGQGNRANSTIGRALQLVIRNVGGGKPGGVDRSALGNPGKVGFSFAEDETDDFWPSLSSERGAGQGKSAVTLFAGDGVQMMLDQKSRNPESLAKSFAATLRGVAHTKFVMASDAIAVVCPEHYRVFKAAGWTRARFLEELTRLLQIPGEELIVGAGGIDEGLPEKMKDMTLPKFRPGGLLIVRAGGDAGMFSGIIGGWGASGDIGSTPVTRML